MTGAMPFRQALAYMAKVYPFKHETRAFHGNLLLYRVQGASKAKLNTPNLNLVLHKKKKKKKQKDGTRTGRQDVNVHLPSTFPKYVKFGNRRLD